MASFKTQQYNILVRDGGDTRNFGSRCCKNIRRGHFTKSLASNTANGEETLLYSRCAQKCITHFIWLRQYLKLHVLAYMFLLCKGLGPDPLGEPYVELPRGKDHHERK